MRLTGLCLSRLNGLRLCNLMRKRGYSVYPSGSQHGVNSLGVICNFWGVTRNQNHNVVRYYERSLRNIKDNKT